MISKEEIIEKVGVLLKELSDKFDYISDPDKDVNPLEFQLFEINAAYFAEHANLLRKLEDEEARKYAEIEESAGHEQSQGVREKEVGEVEHTQLKDIEHVPIVEKEVAAEREEETVLEEKPVEERLVEPIIFTPASSSESVEKEALDSQETVEEIVEEDNNVFSSEDNTVNKQEEEIVKPQYQEEPVPERKVETEPAPEPLKEITHEVVIEEKTLNIHSERPMSLNDRLSEQRKAMDSEKKHLESPRRIKDIKSGINLNDKLLFIKDLFNGYSLAYSEAIELLNRFESFEDADRFLKSNYAQKNSWDTKQASVDKLYAILRQRYG